MPPTVYFPGAPDLMPLAIAFAWSMIAHARFEAEVRNLQAAVTGDATFGERPGNQWPARKRPALMAKLIRNKLGDVAEAETIAKVLRCAIEPSHDRNVLAHGE
jgi:hypothetical protein